MISRKIAISILATSLLLGPVMAQPEKSPQTKDEVITRGEFVSELEVILNRAEAKHQNYLTKSEVSEFRALLMQLREELDALGTREATMSGKSQELDERAENTGRVGF